MQTSISIRHDGYNKTTIINKGKTAFDWRAIFEGQHSKILVGNKLYLAKIENDANGHKRSFVDVKVNPSQRIIASVKDSY